MAKTALIIIADGVEDMEAVAAIDVLTRAGVEVAVAGLKPGPVKAAYGTTVVPETSIDQIESLYDAIVLPGGWDNAESLAADPKVIALIHRHYDEGKLVAAICASPAMVLAEAAGILKGKRATGFPGLTDRLTAGGANFTDQAVTEDGNIITGLGPGAALPFALRVAKYLVGDKIPSELADRWRIRY